MGGGLGRQISGSKSEPSGSNGNSVALVLQQLQIKNRIKNAQTLTSVSSDVKPASLQGREEETRGRDLATSGLRSPWAGHQSRLLTTSHTT